MSLMMDSSEYRHYESIDIIRVVWKKFVFKDNARSMTAFHRRTDSVVILARVWPSSWEYFSAGNLGFENAVFGSLSIRDIDYPTKSKSGCPHIMCMKSG